jgi:branched-chain amino acid transport system ATP-binding protein
MFLRVENLTKHFGGLSAIFELNFELSKGDILGVMGPNGAGKTTLINLLSGFLKPNEGNIFLGGENLVGLKPHRIVQKGIARTFQQVRKFSNLTVLENVKVACSYSRSPGKESFTGSAERKSVEILKFVDLFRKRSYVSKNLPFDDLKRLDIGRALATSPELLMLDEPVSGLTTEETDGIMDLILKINSNGITLIVIEHVMRALMNISKRIIVLDGGKKISEGTPKEVSRDQKVIEVYLGEMAERYA